jgi:hypothetical protein
MTRFSPRRDGSLKRRLERLEAGHAAKQHEASRATGNVSLMATILAVRRGNLQGTEAVATGYARALGFSGTRDLSDAMDNDFELWRERHAEAWLQLLAGEGIDEINLSLEELRQLAERLVPVELKSRLGLTGSVHA